LLLEFADRLFDETREGGAFQVDHSLAVTKSIRQQSRAAGEFVDAERGAAGAGAALRIGRKRAEKIVKRQEQGRWTGGAKLLSPIRSETIGSDPGFETRRPR